LNQPILYYLCMYSNVQFVMSTGCVKCIAKIVVPIMDTWI